MNSEQADLVLARLVATWPHYNLPAVTVLVWREYLAGANYADAVDAARTIGTTSKWFPVLSEFTEHVAQAARRRELREAEARGLPAPDVVPEREHVAAIIGQAREILTDMSAREHDHRGPDPCPRCGGVAPPGVPGGRRSATAFPAPGRRER